MSETAPAGDVARGLDCERAMACFEIEAEGDWNTLMRILQPFPLRSTELASLAGSVAVDGRLTLRIEIHSPSLADANLIRRRIQNICPVFQVRLWTWRAGASQLGAPIMQESSA